MAGFSRILNRKRVSIEVDRASHSYGPLVNPPDSPAQNSAVDAEILKTRIPAQIIGLSYSAPQQNEPALKAVIFTVLRGWAKIVA
jgi:hypothetical protein